MRCFGRLGKSEMEEEAKYPILILQKTLLAELIIQEAHLSGHPGVNHTMSITRQKFWIPQLRSQVARQVRKCIVCQKLNNLPCKYPDQPSLPAERVVQSRPFQHVGLDYFGPLTIIVPTKEKEKCYGVIITCMVTRLIHLDIVSNQSTSAFLQMLRRFFARRGVPSSITSDNSPTFLLGETILKECLTAAQNDPAVAREISDKEIDWRHITPYAPWQGGFYERLIKSVKYSLYKTLGKTTLSFEELSTVIVEIEALLNTRPLLYSDSSFDRESILRPIDFIQKELQVHFPFESPDNELEDSSYAPPFDIPVIHTKLQAIQALQSSCKLTERFWRVWHTQYLTALREKHQTKVGSKRAGALVPKVGSLVLICDEVQPRHMWRMGRISVLPKNRDGVIREAVITLPSHKRIRRPLNLLLPLELEDTTEDYSHDDQDACHGEMQEAADIPQDEQQVVQPTHGYNLRPRSQNIKEHRKTATSVGSVSAVSNLLFILALGFFVVTTTADSPDSGNLGSKTCYCTCLVQRLRESMEIESVQSVKNKLQLQVPSCQQEKYSNPMKYKKGRDISSVKKATVAFLNVSSMRDASISASSILVQFNSLAGIIVFLPLELKHWKRPLRATAQPFYKCLRLRSFHRPTTVSSISSGATKISEVWPNTATRVHRLSRKHEQVTSSLYFKFNGLCKQSTNAFKYANLHAPNFRLAIRDIDGDAAYLSRLLVRSHPNAEHLETELEKCFNDIRRYITVSRTIRNHFKFMQSDDPFKNAGAGEKVILLTDVRHSATTVKEVLLRVGTRYVLTERIYALQASSARVSAKRYEEWLAKDGGSHKIGPINMTIETELRPLIQVIKQTEHLLAEAKKDLKKESPKDHPREMENFNKLQQLLKEQTEEIRTVRTKLSSLENFVTNGDQYVAQEK
ncbi:hypothetical protein V3C99_012128 [Haemonchus contortus]